MSLFERINTVTRTLITTGVHLRCPNCNEGRMFRHLFRIEDQCEVCGVRFERKDGESIGGMAITMAIVPPLSLAGYFITLALTGIPWWVNGGLWLAFIGIAITWMYRHSRAAWVGVSYLTGGVYADPPQPDTTDARETLVQAARSAKPTTPSETNNDS